MTVTFHGLVDEAFIHLWALSPASAVDLGIHDHDGVVPDWSETAVRARLDALAAVRQRLLGLEGLGGDDAVDRKLLAAEIERTAFEWDELRQPLRLPMEWVYQLDPDLYMKREFASVDDRAEIVCGLLEQAEGFLALARRRLDRVIPATFCDWGIIATTGMAEMIEDDVADAFREADEETRRRLGEAIESASGALRAFADWLEAERLPHVDDSFAIGRENMEHLLATGELLEMSLGEMLAMAEADLEANIAAFVATAAEIDPGVSPRRVYEQRVASIHAGRGELVSVTAAMLEEIRQFLVDKDIISIPSEVRAKVAETPKHLRWAFAMMDTPGPYENVATDAYYLVTPDEPAWSDDEAEEWLRTLNTYALEDISIHEAYPGHYVHFLHYQHAPTEVSKRLASYAFTEGWAHYAEQMMWEEGFRAGDPLFRLAQLSEALVRNCRFVCAIRLHAHGMTVDEATAFFVDQAFYEESAARKEAERGTFDPGYFSYTLGKLQILRLRADYRERMGAAFSLKQFHDRMLSRGAPPVEIMREVLLG
ncbi:MAG TPA: DUF885 domain-containing protein [Acidimicrobiia bacterium]|jgi:hypothetical protein